MPLDDKQVAKAIAAAAKRPKWARTAVTNNSQALSIEVKAGQTVITSEGVYDFEDDGEWILLPMDLWKRTLQRLRAAEPRLIGKGDGGPRRH